MALSLTLRVPSPARKPEASALPMPRPAEREIPGLRGLKCDTGRSATRRQERQLATEQKTQEPSVDGAGAEAANDSLTVTDNRTGESYELPISDGTVKAMDLRQIKVSEDDFGLMAYDPAFTNTAPCRSAIPYIDGEAGILQHRGYSIEQLCEQSTFLEVAYLLVFGELPTEAQLEIWTHDIPHHTFVHEDIKKFLEGFRYDAHPMGMLLASVGALSTFYP